MADYRLGIDFGGTKIELVAINREGREVFRDRVVNPGNYDQAILDIRDLVLRAESGLGCIPGSRLRGLQKSSTLGIGIPGSLIPENGKVRNANAVWLNGRLFRQDLEKALDRPIRVENDANCFALSEAVDGAGAGAGVVLGVILGTGMGGGIVANGRILSGRHLIAGEWGHIPLPWPDAEDLPMRKCFCGLTGCQERYLCGQALAEDWLGPGHLASIGIEEAAANGDKKAQKALARYVTRLAKACGQIITIFDPEVIVLGGGISNIKSIYKPVMQQLKNYAAASPCYTSVRCNKHGDSSGVRGAAWLWDTQEIGLWDENVRKIP